MAVFHDNHHHPALYSPSTEVYRAAMNFVEIPESSEKFVTRAEYQESGSTACMRKFRDWKPVEQPKGKGKVTDEASKGGRQGATRKKT